MRSELLIEVPLVGEVLLEPFKYSNGRFGYMCVTEEAKFNLTINPLDIEYSGEDGEMLLKMYDTAEVVSRHLLAKTDMFKKVTTWSVGRNYAQVVKLNKDYYEK